ncbi:MAG: hypothetical protein EOP42_04290 [Sphingobacteriaceae bacterium]|nr:MAG: hypothetical protein EOP42_04290 [Sphingobacteriaceae bacterium]
MYVEVSGLNAVFTVLFYLIIKLFSFILIFCNLHQPSNSTHPERLYFDIKCDAEPDTAVFANVLTALNLSFHSFIVAELHFRNSEVKSALKKEITTFAAAFKLSIYKVEITKQNLKFSVGINQLTGSYRLLKDAADLKTELFALYADTVFSTELFSPDFIKKLSARYNAKQRIDIFKPFADLTNQQQLLLYFGKAADAVNLLWQPTNDLSLISNLIPEAVKLPKTPVETYYQYIKTGEENDLFGKRSRYEKVLIKDNPKHDLYPYQLQKITVKGKKYTFSKQLAANVSVKNGLYEITFPDLLINVKHENRSGAEKAFDAAVAVMINQLEKEQSPKNNLIKLKEILNEY